MIYRDCQKCEYLIPGYMGRRCLRLNQYLYEIEVCNAWVEEEEEFITNEEIEN